MATASISVANSVLTYARSYIGKKTYAQMDCSHFVHAAYHDAGLDYPYTPTAKFATLATGAHAKFELVENSEKQAGDVILMPGHMGIFDPQGCTVLSNNVECVRLKKDAPFLSSRTEGNRGPDFGQTKW